MKSAEWLVVRGAVKKETGVLDRHDSKSQAQSTGDTKNKAQQKSGLSVFLEWLIKELRTKAPKNKDETHGSSFISWVCFRFHVLGFRQGLPYVVVQV